MSNSNSTTATKSTLGNALDSNKVLSFPVTYPTGYHQPAQPSFYNPAQQVYYQPNFPWAEVESVDGLAKKLSTAALAESYKQALDFLIDAISRFAACGCDVTHEKECLWGKGLKEIADGIKRAMNSKELSDKLQS